MFHRKLQRNLPGEGVPGSMRPRSGHPIARALGETSLMFLVHHTISGEQMRDVCRAVEKVMAEATVAG